jgi:ABC-type molybdate transport system ATPase subunit
MVYHTLLRLRIGRSLGTDEGKGIEFGRHLILKKNQKSYVNSKSFTEYIKSTFMPHVARIHAAREVEREDAALLMDNCQSHLTSDVRDCLNTARVSVVTFRPHTTQIFQLLDLTLVGMFTRDGKYHLPFSDLGTTVNFVHNVYLKMAKTLTA